jgi:hypothetical protein
MTSPLVNVASFREIIENICKKGGVHDISDIGPKAHKEKEKEAQGKKKERKEKQRKTQTTNKIEKTKTKTFKNVSDHHHNPIKLPHHPLSAPVSVAVLLYERINSSGVERSFLKAIQVEGGNI